MEMTSLWYENILRGVEEGDIEVVILRFSLMDCSILMPLPMMLLS